MINLGKHRTAWLAAIATLACSLAAASTIAQTPLVRDAAALRVAAIGYRLAIANADLCKTPRFPSGLLLHELGQYDARDRAMVARASGLSDGFGVLGVVPGSAADRAGLAQGDEIVAVAGRSADAIAPVHVATRGSSLRMAAFDRAYEDAQVANAAITVRVRRAGETRDVVVPRAAGCGGDVVLQTSRAFNAWSDGRDVALSTMLVDGAIDDDELAFVVAHEMAHNLVDAPHARGKEAELAADTFAVRLLARAGYRVGAAADFLRHAAARRRMDLPLSHPGLAHRIAAIAQAERALVRTATVSSPAPVG